MMGQNSEGGNTESEKATAVAPKVSVVVPVYNVEKYLDRCIESVVAQTLQDIEIILVDDGAKDSSGSMCDAWAARDSRIRVIHKENGGLSDARNAGVKAARAEFVGFVDSDDYIVPEMYERLHSDVVEDGSDIAVGGVMSVYADHSIASEGGEKCVIAGREAVGELLSGEKLRIWVPLKLYRKSLLEEVPFPTGRTYEDAFVAADIFVRAKKVSIDLQPLYCYVHHEGTITTQPFSSKSMDIVDAYQHAYDVVVAECPEHEPAARFRLIWSRFTVLDKMLLDESGAVFPQQREVVAYLRSHWTEVLSSPYVGRGRKLSMLALKLSVSLYRAFAKVNAQKYRAD